MSGILSEIVELWFDESPMPGRRSLSNADADLWCSERAYQLKISLYISLIISEHLTLCSTSLVCVLKMKLKTTSVLPARVHCKSHTRDTPVLSCMLMLKAGVSLRCKDQKNHL